MTDRIVSVGDDLTIPSGVVVPAARVTDLLDVAASASQGAKADAALPAASLDTSVDALVSDPGSATSAALSSTIGAAVESSVPTGLGWAGPSITPALESTIIPGRRQVGGVGATPEEMFDAVSTARSAPGATFYVTTTGSDSAAGTSWGTAFLTMSKAIQAANATGVPTRINVGPGIYARAGSPYNASTVPTVDIALIASGGRVNVGVFDLITSSTLDGTYANCYTYTLANCDRVCDLTQRDRFGNYVDMRKVTSTAICNRTPNSWILTGGVLYVNRADGAAITTTNTRVYRTVTYAMAVTSAVNVFIGGNGYGAGFDFEGGSTSVIAFNQGAGGATAAQKTVVVADSTILYGTANGLSAETWPGTVACFATRADANGADGFNIHNTYTAPAAACRLLTVNCTARDNGRSGNSSCNGLTGHETTRIVDVAGYYEANHGGTVAVVGSAKAYLIGTTVKDDLGDLMLGGTNPPSGVKVANTVELWAERVTVDMPQGGLVWNAIDATSSVHRRNCPPVPAPDAGSGTFDTY